jgi:hypothetical protein
MKTNMIPVLVRNRNITPDIILQYCRSDPMLVGLFSWRQNSLGAGLQPPRGLWPT